MTNRLIQIVRLSDETLVNAEFVTGLRVADLTEIDQQWLPTRQRIHRWLRDRHVPRAQWPQNGGWDWTVKSKSLQLLAVRGFGIRVADQWQAAAMINVAQFESRLPNTVGKPLVYLDYVEVAPMNWPERISGKRPMYGDAVHYCCDNRFWRALMKDTTGEWDCIRWIRVVRFTIDTKCSSLRLTRRKRISRITNLQRRVQNSFF